MLKGRDIQRYKADFAERYLIGTHNGIREKGIRRIDVNNYPAIKAHLDSFEPKLSKRSDKGDTPYNLRNCAYWQEFEKEKIYWQRVTKEPIFSYAEAGMYILDSTAFMVSGNFTKFLLGILNSKTIKYYVSTYVHKYGDTGMLLANQYVEKICVPIPNKQTKIKFEQLYDSLISAQNAGKNIQPYIDAIDQAVYELYGFTQDEINIIEKSVNKK